MTSLNPQFKNRHLGIEDANLMDPIQVPDIKYHSSFDAVSSSQNAKKKVQVLHRWPRLTRQSKMVHPVDQLWSAVRVMLWGCPKASNLSMGQEELGVPDYTSKQQKAVAFSCPSQADSCFQIGFFGGIIQLDDNPCNSRLHLPLTPTSLCRIVPPFFGNPSEIHCTVSHSSLFSGRDLEFEPIMKNISQSGG